MHQRLPVLRLCKQGTHYTVGIYFNEKLDPGCGQADQRQWVPAGPGDLSGQFRTPGTGKLLWERLRPRTGYRSH